MANMEITTKIGCKNACVYCPQDKLIGAYSQKSNTFLMTFDVFKKCLEKIPKDVTIDFGGMCEPWLNPKTTEMISHAHEKGHIIGIFTTLVGMKLHDIDLLESINRERNLESFTIHLPSMGNNEKIEINESYLNLLEKLLKTNMRKCFKFQGAHLHPKLKLFTKDMGTIVLQSQPHTRALNVSISAKRPPKKRRYRMDCKNNLKHNVLLPNGDVVLCCMDYGMKHILGNLLSSDYNSLFLSKEFLLVKEGLKNDSLDILCRYCEEFARHPLAKYLRKVKI